MYNKSWNILNKYMAYLIADSIINIDHHHRVSNSKMVAKRFAACSFFLWPKGGRPRHPDRKIFERKSARVLSVIKSRDVFKCVCVLKKFRITYVRVRRGWMTQQPVFEIRIPSFNKNKNLFSILFTVLLSSVLRPKDDSKFFAVNCVTIPITYQELNSWPEVSNFVVEQLPIGRRRSTFSDFRFSMFSYFLLKHWSNASVQLYWLLSTSQLHLCKYKNE